MADFKLNPNTTGVVSDRETAIAGLIGFIWPIVLGACAWFIGHAHTSHHWWDYLVFVPTLLSFFVIADRLGAWHMTGEPKIRNRRVIFTKDPIHSAVALRKLADSITPPPVK